MKLYTEEMFLIAAEKCEVSMIDAKHIMQYIDEYVTPIEVPSDEEIENKMHSTEKYHIMKDFYCDGFKDGAKYIINKIQGGNKCL